MLTRLDQVRSLDVVKRYMSAPPLSVLYPFVVLNSNPYIPPTHLVTGLSLIATGSLGSVSRKQFIDALVELSRNKQLIAGEYVGVETLVVEVCLEYIGRRWRESEEKGVVGVDEIAKKFIEVDLEVRTSERL